MRISGLGFNNPRYVHKYYTDAHVHTGKLHTDEYIKGAKYELENIFNDSIQIANKNQNQFWNASDIIISDADCLNILEGRPSADEFNGNKRLLEKFNIIKPEKPILNYNPSPIDRIVRPLAVCETGYGNASEIEKLMGLYHDKFYGLKFHPEIFRMSVTDNYDTYLPYMKIAQKYNKPSLFHSDNKNSVFSIIHVDNTGSAFGLFQDSTFLLSVLGVIAVIFISFYVFKNISFKDKIELFSLTIFMGGTLGNLYERIKFGHVVDYIKLNFISFPVFNAFDIMICIGVFLYIVFVLFDFKIFKRVN